MLARLKPSRVSMLKQDKLARLIFSWVNFGPLNLRDTKMVLIG